MIPARLFLWKHRRSCSSGGPRLPLNRPGCTRFYLVFEDEIGNGMVGERYGQSLTGFLNVGRET